MIGVGILDSGGCNVNVIPSPDDLKTLKNEAVFYIEQTSGVDCGFSDNEYWQQGCNLVKSRDEVIRKANIILLDDQIPFAVQPDKRKIFITNIDVLKDFNKFLCLMENNVDVYSFHSSVLDPQEHKYTFQQTFMDFIRFYLGEPITPEKIYAFARSKVVANGKIVYKPLLKHLNNF
jgi:hypothetical protein